MYRWNWREMGNHKFERDKGTTNNHRRRHRFCVFSKCECERSNKLFNWKFGKLKLLLVWSILGDLYTVIGVADVSLKHDLYSTIIQSDDYDNFESKILSYRLQQLDKTWINTKKVWKMKWMEAPGEGHIFHILKQSHRWIEENADKGLLMMRKFYSRWAKFNGTREFSE